ncbi:hypothetical protein BJY52DRAFT_1200836 [Lactarius psammicola]|nr:hypothetical protein BJY52DRAFT_1200836 [Lactarius psammicola]
MRDFESRVHHDFTDPRLYPTVVLLLHLPGVNPSPSNSIPSFAAHVSLLKDTPVVPSPPITYPFSPEASTSPASSVSPQTPPDVIAPSADCICDAGSW